MPPMCRKGAMMADPAEDLELSGPLLLGGLSSHETFDRTVWSLAVPNGGWEQYVTKENRLEPKARWKGSFCRVDSSSVLLFGGSDNTEYFDDTWQLKQSKDDVGEWKEIHTKGKRPAKRRAHSGVIAGGKYMVIFGGKNGETKEPLKDLWTLDLQDWTWREHADIKFPAPPRKGHSAVMLGNEMFVFGGRSSNTDYYDQLIALRFDSESWAPVSWREVKPAAGSKRPQHRNHHVAGTLGEKRMVIYGGRDGHDPSFPLMTDIWIFDATTETWTSVVPFPDPNKPRFIGLPRPRIESATATLGPEALIIAGGRDWEGKTLNDAWILEVPKGKTGATWRSVAPLDCQMEEVSQTVTYVSFGFFIGLCVVLGMFLMHRYRLRIRRAPYEPIASDKPPATTTFQATA